MSGQLEDLAAESKAHARAVYDRHGVEGLAMHISTLVGAALAGQPKAVADLTELRRLLYAECNIQRFIQKRMSDSPPIVSVSRPVCVPCRREMQCEQVGAIIHRGDGNYQAGERYACPDCLGEFFFPSGEPSRCDPASLPSHAIHMPT